MRSVRQALKVAECGGCTGRNSAYCHCTPAEYKLVHLWERKYPIGSIDIGAEIFNTAFDLLEANPRYVEYCQDLDMDVIRWIKIEEARAK